MMANNWMPPDDNDIFVGDTEEFLNAALNHLRRGGYSAHRWMMDSLEILTGKLPGGQFATRAFVRPEPIGGGRCRLYYSLDRGSWAEVRAPIEWLLAKLDDDDWLEKKAAGQDAPPAPAGGDVPTAAQVQQAKAKMAPPRTDVKAVKWKEKYFPKTDNGLRGWLATWDFIVNLPGNETMQLRHIMTALEQSANPAVGTYSKSQISRILTAGRKYYLFNDEELRNRLR